MNKRLDWIIAVTNDINSDQRMMRIANTLLESGCTVLLIGRKSLSSNPLLTQSFNQSRFRCFFHQGPLFYAEYNLRLLWFLMRNPVNNIYSVDLDTLMACTLASVLRRCPLIFDAHEDFTAVPELLHKPIKQSIWHIVGKWCIPKAKLCMTVGESIGDQLYRKYKAKFHVIRNVPNSKPIIINKDKKERIVLVYQGQINQGRGIKELIDAIATFHKLELWIIGKGDLWNDIKKYVTSLSYKNRIQLFGWISPDEMHAITSQADIGVNLLDPKSPSYYHSLANKIFDYIMAGLPVLTMNFPEYQKINQKHNLALLIDDLQPSTLNMALKQISEDDLILEKMKRNSSIARTEYTWEAERLKMLKIFDEHELNCTSNKQ